MFLIFFHLPLKASVVPGSFSYINLTDLLHKMSLSDEK